MKSDMTKKLSSWKWYILAAIIIILGLIFMFIRRRP
jgi:bacteriorhodopsin